MRLRGKSGFRASTRGEAIALVDGERSLTYAELNDAVSRVVAGLLNGEASLKEERVAFLYPASFDYAALIIGVVAAAVLPFL